jgi:hypothetical protein
MGNKRNEACDYDAAMKSAQPSTSYRPLHFGVTSRVLACALVWTMACTPVAHAANAGGKKNNDAGALSGELFYEILLGEFNVLKQFGVFFVARCRAKNQ